MSKIVKIEKNGNKRKRNVAAMITIKNFDKYYASTMEKGHGFHINAQSSITDKRERVDNGIYSAEYGTTWGNEDAFSDKYTCECKKSMGKEHQGEICPECGTEIVYSDANLKMTGWIIFEKDRLIHPGIFPMLQTLIGTKRLAAILKSTLETDLKGRYKTIDFNEKLKSKDPKKYDGIGLLNFMMHYDVILDFFLSKKKDKKDVYDFLRKQKSSTFINKVPIYSVFLRPITLNGTKLSFHDINAKIENLMTRVWRLNNEKKKMTLNNYYKTLEECQMRVMDIHEHIESTLKGKKGDFRNKIYGYRSDYTARMVIIPLSGTKVNEIELPYQAVLHLYKPEIINLLTKIGKIRLFEALCIWEDATEVFDKQVYEIMMLLINNNNCTVGINRNPTIEYGSILTMRVAKIGKDIDDYCMAIPLNILGPIAGDFDGRLIAVVKLY